MADIELFIKEYSKFISSFKHTSYDDKNGIYLCYDTVEKVINFDLIILKDINVE